METDRKTKIFWNDAEKRSLIAECVGLMRAGEAGTHLAALNIAQRRVLPSARQRKLATVTGMDWLVNGVKEGLAREKEMPPPTAPERIEPRSLGEIWPSLRSLLVEELAHIIDDALRQSQLGALQQPHRAEVTPIHREPRQRLLSVLVVGLRGGQVPEIQREFEGKLDLRFATTDKSKDELRHACQAAHVVVGFTDFLDHSREALIQSRARQYVRSGGGMTRLKDTLNSLLELKAA